MDRRTFIRTGAGAVAALAAGGGALGAVKGSFVSRPVQDGGAAPDHPPERATVFESEGITEANVAGLLAGLGGLEGLMSVPPARATVLLKPNLCLPDPPLRGTTTSPEVLELLCRVLVAGGVRRIVIADHTLKGTGNDFERLPVFDLPRRYPEVKVVLANEERMYEPVPVEGKALRSTQRLKLLARADLFINIPAAKHHSATQVSLGVKNLMGVVWNRADFHTRLDLSQAVGDLATLIRPTLTIVDASRVLLTGGPTGPGKILQEGRLFASRDTVAVDAVVTSRYNFGERTTPPSEVQHLRAAADHGVGIVEMDRITVSRV